MRSKQARRSLSAAIAAQSASADDAGCASAQVDASSKPATAVELGRLKNVGLVVSALSVKAFRRAFTSPPPDCRSRR
jgi:hypothetical protein